MNAGAGLINGGLVGLGGSITFDIGAGNGIATSADSISINLTTSGTSAATTSNSGLEISSSGLALLRGCTNNQILKWSTSTQTWACSDDLTGGGGSLTVRESDLSPSVSNVSTLEFGPATTSSDEFIITDQTGGVARVILGNKIVKTDTSQSLTNKTYEGLTITANGSNTLNIAANKTLAVNNSLTFSGTDATAFTFPATGGTVTVLGNATTGTGSIVLATSPTLTTPNIGVATATSLNKLFITAPATNATLTIANGKTLTVNNTLTLGGTDNTVFTFPSASGTVVTLDANQTLTNKTISGSNNTLSNIATSSLTNSSLTVNAGAGLINGGLVGLGGSITLDVGAGFGITANANDIAIATNTAFTWGGAHTFNVTTTLSALTMAGDTITDFTGSGLQMSGNNLAINLTSSGTTTNTASNSGLEVSASGLAMLRGCSNGQILKWSTSTNQWQCSSDISGGSPTLDSIAAAITDGAVQDSNANTVNWNWDFTTAATDTGLNISESSASINGTQNQQALVKITTLAGSTASPLQITSNSADVGDIFIDLAGSGDFEIRDAGTPFVTFTDAGAINLSGHLTLSADANEGISGGGLVDCNASNQVLQWDDATNKFSCLTVSSLPQMRSFTDTTVPAVADNDTTIYFDDSPHPNLTPVSASNEILIMATYWFDTTVAADNEIAVVLRTDTTGDGVVACTDTIVGTITSAMTSDIIQSSASVVFVHAPATTNKVAYTVCSSVDTVGSGSIPRIDITLYEINNAADLAEVYATNDTTLVSGDVVSIDSTLAAGVKRSSMAYDRELVGVVSTKPALVMGGRNSEGVTGVPVALSGRIPVKVSTENGRVKAGDLLTSSNIPGVAMKAMKAGKIIGQALQDFNYPDGEVGLIIAFVNTSYFHGTNLTSLLPGLTQNDNISTDDFGKQILTQLVTQKDTLNTSSTMSEILTDRLAAGLEIISPRVLTQGLVVEGISALDKEIAFNNDVIFFGRPYFNTDTAGFAVIKEGGRKVEVVFEKEYMEQPIVSAIISLEEDNEANDELIFTNGINYIVTKKSLNGFTILLNKPAPKDIKFSWIALAVKNPKIFTSESLQTELTQPESTPPEPVLNEAVSSEVTSQTSSSTQPAEQNQEPVPQVNSTSEPVSENSSPVDSSAETQTIPEPPVETNQPTESPLTESVPAESPPVESTLTANVE